MYDYVDYMLFRVMADRQRFRITAVMLLTADDLVEAPQSSFAHPCSAANAVVFCPSMTIEIYLYDASLVSVLYVIAMPFWMPMVGWNQLVTQKLHTVKYRAINSLE